MSDEKKTHYQVSFTGGQALTAVVVLLVGLGLAFFLGARAGFERSAEPEAAPVPHEAPSPSVAAVPSPAVPPPVPATASPAPTTAAPGTTAEEAPVFEDREAGVSEEPKTETKSPAASSSPSRTEIPGVPPGSTAGAAPRPPKPEHASTPAPVAAAPATPKEKAAAPAKKAAGFVVQVLSTASKSEASRWKDRLAGKGYRTATVTAVDSKKGKLYRVRIGPYATRALANKAAAKVNADFRQKAWVASE